MTDFDCPFGSSAHVWLAAEGFVGTHVGMGIIRFRLDRAVLEELLQTVR